MKLKLLRSLLLLLMAAPVFVMGCVSTGGNHNYKRLGETTVVTNDMAAVSNAVVRWAGTLTNGYSLLRDAEARRSYVELVFKNDPRVVFMLMNERKTTAPWGASVCDKGNRGLFYATIIIRLQALESGVKIAVAVHESKVTDQIWFNFHTGFQKGGRTVALSPCPMDERAVISELESNLRKIGASNPPGVQPNI